MIMSKQCQQIKWCVHLVGPDDVLACEDFKKAARYCAAINESLINHAKTAVGSDNQPVVFARVAIWDEVASTGSEHNPASVDWSDYLHIVQEKWQLIFCSIDSIEVQVIEAATSTPEHAAYYLKHNPGHEWLDGFYLAAAVKGSPIIRTADNARSEECGLQ